MCDYSLFAVPNRLASEQEDLVAHRFPTGSMGLASPDDLGQKEEVHQGFWSSIKNFFAPAVSRPVPAVCIPPGARLNLSGISERMQTEYGVGESEDVTFVQLSASSYAYRDAVQFGNGKQMLLQELAEGQKVRVLSLELADPEWQPFREELHIRLR
jgi:hypothetical protein